MEYIVVMEKILNLDDKVEGFIERGWKPQGGIALKEANDGTYGYQAMVRESPKEYLGLH